MNSKLDIDRLKEQLSDKDVISLKDIDAFYREKEPSIPKTTVSWRIYSLLQQEVLQRVGHGKYSFGTTQYFIPKVSHKMKQIGQTIKKKFPFIKYCQWELSSVNLFSQHLINFNVLFVDVERDAVESVYYELKESYSKVMLIQNLYDNLSEFGNTIIVRPLITDAPIQKNENTYIVILEKLLVDLCTDKEFISFQGNEIYHIYENAFDKYTINQQTMLRYAGRKTKREEIAKILKTINRQ
ncbi:hypothetical protein EZS27_025484 [termite gut metagenome]|uniref:Uncharacterized protein n=1 Tax=termite gut metagenome TaxID=433724 RepID=A0A5J4QUP4_9ZZZZ